MAESTVDPKTANVGASCSPSEGPACRNGVDNGNDGNVDGVAGGDSTRSTPVVIGGETPKGVTTSGASSTMAQPVVGLGACASTTVATAQGDNSMVTGGPPTATPATLPSSSSSSSSSSSVGAAAGGTAITKDKDDTKISGNGSPRSPKHARKTRIKLTEQQLESATRDELVAKWREQDLYVECLEAQAAAQEGELGCLRDSEEKYRQQCCEISHRERILVRRLASKEQQMLGYVNELTEMRASQTPTASALRSALLDPAVNILIKKLRQELLSTKAKLEDTQNELSAWKFTPDSNTGKRLMAKCRLLYQENEDLGRMIASGRIAKLEGELALQKSFSEEVKKSQSELDEFLQDLDEDVEGMQSTIYFLQQELRKARESVSLLQQENNNYKSAASASASSSCPGSRQAAQAPQPPHTPPPPPPPLPPPAPQSVPPPPPSPPGDNNNLSNGTSLPSSHGCSTKNAESSNDVSDRPESVDERIDASPTRLTSLLPSSSLCRSSVSSSTITESSTSVKVCLKDVDDDLSRSPMRSQLRSDEAGESSDDSAALIIKVDNEELSDRDDDDDEEEEEEVVESVTKKKVDRSSTTTTTTTTATTAVTAAAAAAAAESTVKVSPPSPSSSPSSSSSSPPSSSPSSPPPPPPTPLPVDSCETRRPQRHSVRTKDKISTTKNSSAIVGKSNGDDFKSTSRTSTRRLLRDRTAKREKSGGAAADSDDERRQHKKKRRESVLSLDYNETEDDALLITNGETIQSDLED